MGLNVQGAGEIIVDEIRIGDTYGDVVGAVTVPPGTPTGLNATPGTNLVSLSWTAATGSPTGYNVKRSTVSGGPYDHRRHHDRPDRDLRRCRSWADSPTTTWCRR